MPECRSDQAGKLPLTMRDRARKTLHLPAKPAAEPAPKPAEQAAPAKPRVSPEEQRAREAADQEAKRIRLAALSKDAEALKATLIDRYPHLFAVNPPRPLASGIHRVLAEQTEAPMRVLRVALAKLTRRNAYLAALGEAADHPPTARDPVPERRRLRRLWPRRPFAVTHNGACFLLDGTA